LEVGSTSRTQQLKCRVVSISATKNTDLLARSKSSEQTGCSVLATATDMRAGKIQVCRTKQPMCEQSFYSAHCCIKAEIKYIVLDEDTMVSFVPFAWCSYVKSIQEQRLIFTCFISGPDFDKSSYL